MKTEYTEQIMKILTSGMTTGQILKALTELKKKRDLERKLKSNRERSK